MATSTKKREYFFTKTSDGSRFVKGDKPKEREFRLLLESIPFFSEIDSSAGASTSGLVKIASDTIAKNRTDDYVIGTTAPKAVLPYQLPSIEGAGGTEAVSGGSAVQEGGLKITPISKDVGSKSRLNFRIELDISSLSNATPTEGEDFIPFIDVTDGSMKKALIENFIPSKNVVTRNNTGYGGDYAVRPYTSGDNLVDFQNLYFKAGNDAYIKPYDTDEGDGMYISAGDGSSGTGGAFIARGGNSTSDNGGYAYLIGGNGGSDADGGGVNLTGGTGSGASGNSGGVNINAGSVSGGATVGTIKIGNNHGNVGIGGSADATDKLKVTGNSQFTGTIQLDTLGSAGASDDVLVYNASNIISKVGLDAMMGNVGSGAIPVAALASGIPLSKLATVATGRVLVSDGSGNIIASSRTSTELDYLNGVSSNIQTQLTSVANKAGNNTVTISTSTYNCDGSEKTILIDATSNNVAIYLPAADDTHEIKIRRIDNASGNSATIYRVGTDVLLLGAGGSGASVTNYTLDETGASSPATHAIELASDGNGKWYNYSIITT